MSERTCAHDGCDRRHYARGLCASHYQMDRYVPKVRPSRSELFWTHVQQDGECWVWTGALTNSGYGKFSTDALLAHRYAYEQMIGDIPAGLQLDHLCMNKRCVNPYHLEPVSGVVNRRRAARFYGVREFKTECPQGHPYTEENTARRNGRRHCRACGRERAARNRARRTA